MPQEGSPAAERAWTFFPRIEADLIQADRHPRYFWRRHVPIVVSFCLFTCLPFVERWTGLVPELCAVALLFHLLAFGSEVHFHVSDRIGATVFSALVFTVNFLVVIAICATPGRFVALVWPLYFMYLPIPSLAAPRSVYVATIAMVSPFVAGATWSALGTSTWSDSFVLLGIVSALALLGYMLLTGYGAQFRRERALLEKARVARAREEQKLAIADDLHDTLGIALAEAALWQGIGKSAEGEDARVAFERAEKRLGEAMHELRASVASLSDKDIGHETLEGLVRARIESLCQAASVELDLRFEGANGHLEATKALELVKIAEEATSNAIRHGKPGRLRLHLGWQHGLSLIVSDDGKGFDPSSVREGHGLSSLRRRALALGGTLDIQSSVGEGTTIAVRVRNS